MVGDLAPVMNAPSWPLHPVPGSPVRDDFDRSELHPRWVSPRSRRPEDCGTRQRPGWLTLRARGASLDAPDVTFLGRRQQHLSCRVRTLADTREGRGGLAVRLDARSGPDVIHLGVEDADGAFTVLARLDGRYLSTEVAGGFTGRVIGLYAVAGTMHFDWLDYQPLD
ncbi:beta-xylosidase family glycoside hydrolase [Micromonospora zhanjiangensis]|uniref:Beta-xylosidase C-terminal Concanavalin A-like domain-containing protein n=1 Tax=Micromonospora zhanjiangensis TaxID=1522057 RepID=A0ABV8KJT2_9ACTN